MKVSQYTTREMPRSGCELAALLAAGLVAFIIAFVKALIGDMKPVKVVDEESSLAKLVKWIVAEEGIPRDHISPGYSGAFKPCFPLVPALQSN